MGHEFIHFDQSLAVQFAADAGIRCIFGIILSEESLPVTDDAYQKTVHFYQAGINLRTVIRTIFHVLAAVCQTCQDFVKVVHLFLVEGKQAIKIFA